MWQQLISPCSKVFSKEASASFFYCFLLLFLRIGLLFCLHGLDKKRNDIGCRKTEICFVKKNGGLAG